MTNFDYIASTDFRTSLASDYSEMLKCAENQSWKSAQVLAGSIVECLLIDYLTSTTNPTRPAKDPLKMDLTDAISICKSEKVLSDRTADLCSVVRSYRNLIHPGRMVRLNEEPPNKTTCEIATALIDLIVSDISKTRRAAVGLTGQQVISKIMRDERCIPILSHLLVEVNEEQRTRILIDLLPSAYFEYREEDDSFDDTKDRLAQAYRVIFETANLDIKRKVTQKYVRLLKEEDGDLIEKYRKAFFRAPDLEFVDPQSYALVKEHILAGTPGVHTVESLRQLDGIGKFLADADCLKWFDPFMRTIASSVVKEHVKRKTKELFSSTICTTPISFDARLKARIGDWLKHYEVQKSEINMGIAQAFLDELLSMSPP